MTGTNYQKLIKVITPELDEIFTTLRDLKFTCRIDKARGGSLDNIGKLLNFERTLGETDSIYRERLQDIIFINTITGTKLAIRELLSNYLRIDINVITIIEDTPNYIIIQLPPDCAAYEQDIERVIKKSVAAGVRVSLAFSGVYWDQARWDDSTYKWG